MTRPAAVLLALAMLAGAVVRADAGSASRPRQRSIGGYIATASESEPGMVEAVLTLPDGTALSMGPSLKSAALPSDPPRGGDSTHLVISMGATPHEIRGFGVSGSAEAASPVRLSPPNRPSSSTGGGSAPAEARGLLRDAPNEAPSGPGKAAPRPSAPPPPASGLVQYYELPAASSYRTVPLAAAAADKIVACRLEVLRLPAGASVGAPPSVLCFGDGEPVFYPDFPQPGQPARFVVWSEASARFVAGLP